MNGNKPEELKDFLKRLRIENGLTLTQLADEIGYSNPYLSQIETGNKKKPSIEFLMRISFFYNVSIVKLLEMAGYNEDVERYRKLESTYKKMREKAPDKYDLNDILGNVFLGTKFTFGGIENSNYESMVIANVAGLLSKFFLNKEPRLSDDEVAQIGDDVRDSLEILLKRM